MKKILLIFILFGLTNFAFAQTIKFTKFTVVAGVNQSTASDIPDIFIKEIADAGQTFPNSKLDGFHVGVLADYSFDKISIQPGLLYETKGGIPYSGSLTVWPGDSFNRKDILRLNYIEVPINVLYYMPVGICKFFIGGGPYTAVGISGKASYTITYNNSQKADEKGNIIVTYGSGVDDMKIIDFGLDAKAGLDIKDVSISINYEYGLADLSNDPRFSGRNEVLGLSLGYSFYKL